jgi:hypothetical protein
VNIGHTSKKLEDVRDSLQILSDTSHRDGVMDRELFPRFTYSELILLQMLLLLSLPKVGWTPACSGHGRCLSEPGGDKRRRVFAPIQDIVAEAAADEPRSAVVRRPGFVFNMAAVVQSYKTAE